MSISTRSIVVAGVLIAVAAVLAVTGLGYFPVPNATSEATIMHVPAIIGGVLEGPVVGVLVGLVFGVNALMRFSGLPIFADQPAWMPFVVLLLPRLFIGIAAWLAYAGLRRLNRAGNVILAALLGALGGYGIVYWLNNLVTPPSANWIAIASLATASVVTALLTWLALSRNPEVVALGAAGVAGTLTNTLLVLGLAVGFGLFPREIFLLSAPQAIFESAVAAVLTIAVVAVWKGVERGEGRSKI